MLFLHLHAARSVHIAWCPFHVTRDDIFVITSTLISAQQNRISKYAHIRLSIYSRTLLVVSQPTGPRCYRPAHPVPAANPLDMVS
jgi:hypothetical protein